MSSFDIALLIVGGAGTCIAIYGLILSHQMDVLQREERLDAKRRRAHPAE
jgi:hypothetical protein